MARGFAATLGVGASDRIDTGVTTYHAIRTWFFQYNRNGDGGGGGFGRVFSKTIPGSGTNEIEGVTNVSTELWLAQAFTGTDAIWRFNRPSTGWRTLSWDYDDSATTNVPVVYIDGTAVTVTTETTPIGTALDDAAAVYYIGNNGASNREFDGMLAEVAKWNRALTADEHKALGNGWSPAQFRRGRVMYLPIVRANVNLHGATPTITGTAVQPHPRLIAPRWTTTIAAPAIALQHPYDTYCAIGATATFTVVVTGTATYQWQDNRTGSFTDVATGTGATTATYTTAATDSSFDGRRYRCIVTRAGGTQTSRSAELLTPGRTGTLGQFDPDLRLDGWF